MKDHIRLTTPEYAERQAIRRASPNQEIWQLLDQVCDPELPGLTLWDLGVLQQIEKKHDCWHIGITLTYSGCPAVEVMQQDIMQVMQAAGYDRVKVDILLSPIWSTDFMSPEGKQHLKSIQIAPPNEQDIIVCPVCDSNNTNVISQFGSTACKSLAQCRDCQETFDYFKHF